MGEEDDEEGAASGGEKKPAEGSLAAMTLASAHMSPPEYRAAHSIKILGMGGEPLPDPATTWATCRAFFDAKLVDPLAAAGFAGPSPIQACAWPIAVQGRDLIAVAKTGSGKTLGFLLPGFKHLAATRPQAYRGDAPKILVLAPTRELAVQIQDDCAKFGKAARVRSVCLFGGAPKSQQIRELQNGVDVVVATPGRLNDLLEMRKANVSEVGEDWVAWGGSGNKAPRRPSSEETQFEGDRASFLCYPHALGYTICAHD
jgi:ATP-dependent RNA helicase DDX5/DBP2